MPFNRPTLAQIIDRSKQDLEDKLTGAAAVLRRSVIAVVARVVAGASHVMHGHIAWAAKQLLPLESDEDVLVNQGNLYLVNRKPATFASRTVLFTGSIGATIPAQTELQRSDGVLYRTQSNAVFTGTTVAVPVVAELAGDEGNVDAGVALQVIEPIANVNNQALVQAGGINGVDAEDIEVYRQRVLFRIANTPQGGTEADYKRWALEVAGVTRAFVFPKFLGPNTVGLSFVLDNEANIVPTPAKVAEMQAYIDARRPVTTDFTAFAPNTTPVNFTIQLLTFDTPAIRAAIIAELKDLFQREGAPGGTILYSHIQEAISLAAGEYDHTLIAPVANVVAAAGYLPVVGTFTWV